MTKDKALEALRAFQGGRDSVQVGGSFLENLRDYVQCSAVTIVR